MSSDPLDKHKSIDLKLFESITIYPSVTLCECRSTVVSGAQEFNAPGGNPPSADPNQVVYADQSRRLINRELDESGVTQLSHPLPRILVPYSQAKQPVVR